MRGEAARRKATLFAAIGALLTFIAGAGAANAQAVILDTSDVLVENSSGENLVTLGSGGDLDLGIAMATNGDLRIFSNAGDVVALLDRADLTVGGINEDGDIFVTDDAGVTTIQLDGDTGTITNGPEGNGLVKAWARINADGTIASCWNCSPQPTLTNRISTGSYEVGFTFAADITSRPFVCSPGHGDSVAALAHGIYCTDRFDNKSQIFVHTEDATGAETGSDFTIVIY